jgi:TolB protein
MKPARLFHAKFIIAMIFTPLLSPLLTPLLAQQTSFGNFENQTDVGNVNLKGASEYQANSQEYIISGSGSNIWFDHDAFHFLYKKMKGDFILTARVEFVGKGVEQHRKVGWMIRQNLDSTSAHVSAVIHGDGLTSLQYRKTSGSNMDEQKFIITAPDIVQLERKGHDFIMSVAHFGEAFVSDKITLESFNDEVFVGIFLCSHNAAVSEKAIFSNVRITVPAKDDFVPYKDYIGSRIETLDVESGKRMDLYQEPKSLQAPNWTKDGKYLIYNSEGKLYRFDIEKKVPELINTGFAQNNNNDHVLSFDGKQIGISDHTQDKDHNSLVYVLPVKGGDPKQVTVNAPSYLHGWSPDSKFLIYTGERNNEFDIYKIPVAGGKEIRLTNAKGLDDGSEFSPDGNYIYFNSNRTGIMQIWRMKPDGSMQEQLTTGSLNNWFPHVSPDGKWLVFISFPNEVDSGDHPFYKHVYLQIMPANGGTARIIAYLYGGQGSINTPSWSPDSRRIAFVSNTQLSIQKK